MKTFFSRDEVDYFLTGIKEKEIIQIVTPTGLDFTVSKLNDDKFERITPYATYNYSKEEVINNIFKNHWHVKETLNKKIEPKIEGNCPICNQPGKFISLGLCCEEHGYYQ